MMEMNIALTGKGKLAVIASVYESVKSAMPGYFSLPDVRDFDAISRVQSEPSIEASSAVTVLLRVHGEELRIHFGESNANIIVSVIDADSMTEGLKEAHEAINSALEKDNALLVIVPAKSEGCDERALTDKTVSAFRKTLELMRTKYRGRACIAVSEAGDKVLRYAVAFMRGELEGELRSFADRFCDGIANDEGVLCGNELLNSAQYKPEAKPVQKSGAGKIIAAFIAGCVIAGAGGYFAGHIETHEADIEQARQSEQLAIQERDKARDESESLRTEKDRAMEMANRYKQQADELTSENKRLQAEVNRLREKDRKSIRLPNPFK